MTVIGATIAGICSTISFGMAIFFVLTGGNPLGIALCVAVGVFNFVLTLSALKKK